MYLQRVSNHCLTVCQPRKNVGPSINLGLRKAPYTRRVEKRGMRRPLWPSLLKGIFFVSYTQDVVLYLDNVGGCRRFCANSVEVLSIPTASSRISSFATGTVVFLRPRLWKPSSTPEPRSTNAETLMLFGRESTIVLGRNFAGTTPRYLS